MARLVLTLAFVCTAALAQILDDAQRRAQQAQQKLDAVRAQIGEIAQQQRAIAAQREALNATLSSQARQLGEAARTLHDTDTAIAEKSAALERLVAERATLKTRLSDQREALAQLPRAAYALNRGSDLSMLLGDEDVARIARALAYSRYFQRDRMQRIRALLGDLAKLDQVKAGIDTDKAALEKQRAERAVKAQALEQARDAQQHLLAAADAQPAHQKDKLAALQRDAQALNELLEKLKNVFADIPKQLGVERPFAQLRGRLPWPAAGVAQHGAGLLSHGLLIAARPGVEAHAVAYGRVAWADFMRGYGMLVIVDHGGGYMSLYGNNEAALVETGD